MLSVMFTDDFRALAPGRPRAPEAGGGASRARPGLETVRVRRRGGPPLRFEAEPWLATSRPATLEPGMMLHLRLFLSPEGEIILLMECSTAGRPPQLVRAVQGSRAALIAQDFSGLDAGAMLAMPPDLLFEAPAEAALAAHAELNRRMAQIRADFAALCAEILNPAPPGASPVDERSEPCPD